MNDAWQATNSAQSEVGAGCTVLHPWLIGRASLLRICLRWTHGNLPEAEDLLSEACVRAVEVQVSGANIRRPRSFWATIIANLARDRLRTAKNRRTDAASQSELEAITMPSPATAPDDLASARQHLARVAHALEFVPERQRAALLLRSFGDEYSYIAETVGTSTRNARKLVRMARTNLQSWE